MPPVLPEEFAVILGEYTNLWLLLIVIGLICLEIILWNKKKRLIAGLFPGGLTTLIFKNWDKRKHLIRQIFFLLAILFLVLALARPQWGRKTEVAGQKGIDVMIAIDVSKSMLAQDLTPNRLENAKTSLNLIIDELAGNRIGLVAFAGTGFINCPLTTDVGAVKIFLKSINTDLIPDPGTDIESAIRECVKAFSKSTNSKVIILLTDGEELSGSALSAAELAQKEGIRIFAVGIGSLEGSPIPTAGGFKKDEKGNIIMSRVNEELLQVLSRKTGGRAFLISQDRTGFQKLFAAIALLPKQRLKRSVAYQYQERFPIFIFLCLLCLAAEMLISERKNA
ncbi:MAG: VWA domain-containing protein [Syntrophaceae bacterium]|nr:VWA domain-containing protein [Syntrophaceae bacterium]